MKKMIEKVLEDKECLKDRKVSLEFSCSVIELEIEAGKRLCGSFSVVTNEKFAPEGYVYSSDLRMLIKTPTFFGLEKEILFQYDSKGLPEDYTDKGVIHIISNYGEYEIPYEIHTTSPFPISSMGAVKNLFHFANLAKANWDEALKLFYSRQFKNVLIGHDAQYLPVYRGLSYCEGNGRNVEHFLSVIKKRTQVSYYTDVKEFNIENPAFSPEKLLHITKEGCGTMPLQIEITGNFVRCNTSIITCEEFEQDVFEVQVTMNKDLLHVGLNKGQIRLFDMYNDIVIPITVTISKDKHFEIDRQRRSRVELMEQYINFRLGKLQKNAWLRNCNSIVGILVQQNPNNIENRLYQAQALLSERHYSESSKILNQVGLILIDNEEVSPVLRGYYNYLQSLNTNDKEYFYQLARETELLHVQNMSSWQLTWFMLYLKQDLSNDEFAKWDLIKSQYQYGLMSPVLYIEALGILLKEPAIFSEISDFELGLIRFLINHEVITSEICSKFVFLSTKYPVYNDEIISILYYCYEKDPKAETLEVICNMLMKGNKIGEQYLKWYVAAIDMELRINKLYEYYIMSLPCDYMEPLPKIVLMYFAYRSTLDSKRLALIYANVIANHESYADIYIDYEEVIKNFAHEQLEKLRIDNNLDMIYSYVFALEDLDSREASLYSLLYHRFVLTLHKDCFVKAVVIYNYLKEEMFFDIRSNEVEIVLLGDDYSILLEDEEGNRYTDEEFYELKRIMQRPINLDEDIYNSELDLEHALMVANMCGDKIVVTKKNEKALLWLSESEFITEEYRRNIMITLTEYYFEEDEISRLDDLLSRFDPNLLTGKEREICIRILVARGMYDKAFDWVCEYGTEQIDVKILVRLCDRMLMRTDFEYEPSLLKICDYIFKLGKYDETILNYLIMYKQGSSPDLKSLWRAADSFGLEVRNLLETMLVQLMYTGNVIGEEENIFSEYTVSGASLQIEELFLEMLAYRYFIKEDKIQESVFERVIYLHQLGEIIPDYSKLAFLKKCAPRVTKIRGLSNEESALALIFLKELSSKGIFFPMFMEYSYIWPKLGIYKDRSYIVYRGNEDSKVILHYVINRADSNDEEYRKEEMPHIIGGIFVQSFILFYGEKIRYYITEEQARQEKLTKASVLEKNEVKNEHEENRYGVINSIAISQEMKDDATFIELSKEYEKKNFLVDSIFTMFKD